MIAVYWNGKKHWQLRIVCVRWIMAEVEKKCYHQWQQRKTRRQLNSVEKKRFNEPRLWFWCFFSLTLHLHLSFSVSFRQHRMSEMLMKMDKNSFNKWNYSVIRKLSAKWMNLQFFFLSSDKFINFHHPFASSWVEPSWVDQSIEWKIYIQ